MELSLFEIWHSMGLMARIVAVSLVAMGFISLFVVIERFFVLGRSLRLFENMPTLAYLVFPQTSLPSTD